MFAFLSLTLQMGHAGQGGLKDYWTKMEQLSCPFYGQTILRARYYHKLCFLHFTEKTGMELTGRMTDYGQCENYLKF
jgi:hypothetical protein